MGHIPRIRILIQRPDCCQAQNRSQRYGRTFHVRELIRAIKTCFMSLILRKNKSYSYREYEAVNKLVWITFCIFEFRDVGISSTLCYPVHQIALILK